MILTKLTYVQIIVISNIILPRIVVCGCICCLLHAVVVVVACCSCPVLLVTGQQSIFNGTTRVLHQAILKTCGDKTKVEFIEIGGVANVLEEKVAPNTSQILY